MAKKYATYNGSATFADLAEFQASSYYTLFEGIVTAEDHAHLNIVASAEQIGERWVGVITAASQEDLNYFNEHTNVTHAQDVATLLSETLIPSTGMIEEERREWIENL
jgi:hypothetical protein